MSHLTPQAAATMSKSFSSALAGWVLTMVLAGPLSAWQLDFQPEAVFDEASAIIESDFFDPELNGLDWPAVVARYRPRAAKATTRDEFATVMSDFVAELKTSHTAWFSVNHPKRYQLLGIFTFLAPDDQPELFHYEGIGIDSVRIDGHTFVRSVFDGLPAARAGLLYGDELITVDGQPFHPMDSFRGKAGTSVTVGIRRDEGGPVLELAIEVENLNARTMFETALDASVTKIEREGKSIGYVHAWSYAGRDYHETISELLIWGDLKDCDAVILDLRDGWGGASFDYLNLFRPPIATMQSKDREGNAVNYTGVWGKPVVLLTNERSTSGKELFAYGFRKLDLGTMVGGRTAGAVVGGSPRMMSNGDVMYLAVVDTRVDGIRLEGKGVAPDLAVERPLQWAGGADPQRDAAVGVALEKVR